jgi:NADP-dependent 3-hydroxy acid dehydrogenase YdfG
MPQPLPFREGWPKAGVGLDAHEWQVECICFKKPSCADKLLSPGGPYEMSENRKLAVVTGASSGIGEATARVLAQAGFLVIVGARRLDRLEKLAKEIDGKAIALDVTDDASVAAFAAQVERVNVLVNNAGGAQGLEKVAEADLQHYETMYQTNVLGLVRVTKALLPKISASGAGHLVNIGSVAALEAYPGGAGYCAAKHGTRVVTETLRQELLGQPVRITEIDPGLVETEFSVVRFGGDADKASKVYAGVTPLTADDIADTIVWAVTRPPHVNIDQIVIKPLDQASAQKIHRRP